MVGDDAASKQCKEEESLVARGISYAAGMVAVWVLVWAVVRTARGRIFVRPTPLTNVKFCLGGQRDIQWLLQERVCPRKTPHRHSVAPPPKPMLRDQRPWRAGSSVTATSKQSKLPRTTPHSATASYQAIS